MLLDLRICSTTTAIVLSALVLSTAGCSTSKPSRKITTDKAAKTGRIQSDGELEDTVIEKVKAATVLIGNFQGNELSSTGSGFVVGDGTRIVTNKHVVTGDDNVVDPLKLVFFSGTERARIVEVEASNISVYGSLERTSDEYHSEDLAYITIGAVVSEPISLAPFKKVKETMPVWAFGFPRGTSILSDHNMPSVTVHSMKIERVERTEGEVSILQFSGSPTHGNSGGPVIDQEGNVLGVLAAKTPDAPILFAIPSIRVNKMLSGDKGGDKNIAQLWKAPIKENDVADERPDSGESAGDAIQNLESPLNSRRLTESDISGYSPFQLTILRNDPFARRGYRFKRKELRRAFGTLSWYVPRTSDLQSVESLLTNLERRNIEFITQYQAATGQTY